MMQVPSIRRTHSAHHRNIALACVFCACSFVAACGPHRQAAAITRVATDDPQTWASTTICFPAPPTEGSLIEQRRVERILELCAAGAEMEGVAVAHHTDVDCAPVTLSFFARDTGVDSGECRMSFSGEARCTARDVLTKDLTVTVARDRDAAPTLETHASLRSTRPAFNDKTYLALCRVAFLRFPESFDEYSINMEIVEVPE